MDGLELVKKKGAYYMDSREVAEMVGKRHDNLVRDIEGLINKNNQLSEKFFTVSSYTIGGKRKYKMFLISDDGLEMLVNRMRLTMKQIEQLNLKYGIKLVVCDQTRNENKLSEILIPFVSGLGYEVQPQYKVDKYRIDFYIKELKLAIEFDEEHHRFQAQKDSIRQEYIEKTLGCTFVRIKEGDNVGFSLSKIANKITEARTTTK